MSDGVAGADLTAASATTKLTPLFGAFATPYRFTIDDILAEGDRVVVRGRGEVKTKAGKGSQSNSYWSRPAAGGRQTPSSCAHTRHRPGRTGIWIHQLRLMLRD